MTPLRLFEVVVELDTRGQTDLPARHGQASTWAYTLAGDGPQAADQVLAYLRQRSLCPLPVAPRVCELPVAGWDAHVARVWPAFAALLPTQAALEAACARPGEAQSVHLGAFYPHD